MAILKHIASKSSNYGAALEYLIFKHDELRKTPILDQNGNRIMRDEFYLDGLNCEPYSFDAACQQLNREYQKNKNKNEIKSHHYIISFDPRDSPDNGLTVDKAQELGERFCREQFPGHQAIVCTHPDGHNQSGNIHVHIVINSLRIENVPLLPYMDRPADTKAGCKHRCTDAAMEYFKSEVMELCHEAGLYQIDLLNGSANRVTEREYWARKKGQAALDRENAALAAEGKPTKPTRFETDKEKLRQIIRKTLNESFTVEDFARKLLQYGVTSCTYHGGSWVLWGSHCASYEPGNVTSMNLYDSTLMMMYYLANDFQVRRAEEIDKIASVNRIKQIVAEEQATLDALCAIGALLYGKTFFVLNEETRSDMLTGDFALRWEITQSLAIKSITGTVQHTDAGLATYYEELMELTV